MQMIAKTIICAFTEMLLKKRKVRRKGKKIYWEYGIKMHCK